MILPPFAAPADFTRAVHPPSGGESRWFIFRERNQLLVGNDKRTLLTDHELSLQRTLYLGSLKGINFFAGEVEAGSAAPSGCYWSHLRSLYTSLNEAEYAIAGCAIQLLYWDRTNQFCGTCGNVTVSRDHERCRECKACGHLAYPKLSLAILALVKRGSQILLARHPKAPEPFYSALAGFVDPSETLEQCVMREVLEEVGIRVKNVRYFGSQPWPFSYSFMIGFTCEWQEGEIQIDPAEIAEAAWFDVSNLPHLPPPFSLSRILIDNWSKVRASHAALTS